MPSQERTGELIPQRRTPSGVLDQLVRGGIRARVGAVTNRVTMAVASVVVEQLAGADGPFDRDSSLELECLRND